MTELVGHCYFGDKKQFDEWTEDDIHTQLSGYDVGTRFKFDFVSYLGFLELVLNRGSKGDDNFEKFCHYAKAHFTQIFK